MGLLKRDAASTDKLSRRGPKTALPLPFNQAVAAAGRLADHAPAVDGKTRASVPLRQVANFRFTEGLNEVSRDDGKRRIYVEANVRGRDLGSFVDEAQRRRHSRVQECIPIHL
jgi:cobalt-zinc-cadmium resistance protein CzcA